MAVLPFGLWDVGESFTQAVDLEEEELDQYEDVKIRTKYDIIKPDATQSLDCESLIIACGDAANTFLETYLNLPDKYIAEIKPTESTITTKNKKQTCFIYKLDESYICFCKLFIKPEDCFTWVEQLLSSITTKRISILSSSPKSSFQGSDELKHSDEDLLRYLKSSTVEKKLENIQELEEGNIIANLPAAVMSYCEMFKVATIVYMNFTESHYIDGFTLKAYEDILHDVPFTSLPMASKETIYERLKSFEGIGVADNNLYI